MSIAAISSSFVAAVRGRAAIAPAEPVAAAQSTVPAHREGGRRHELVDAMKQVLGVEAEQDRSDDQAIFRFAHALMHELRSIDAGGEHDGPGRGHAWGRRSWSDLPQRIDALATAAAASSAAAAEASSEPVVPPAAAPAPEAGAVPSVPVAAAEAPAPVEVPEPELPPQPNPVTTTSAALHLMQVPSSRLLEAYTAMMQALVEQADAPAAGDARSELAALLDRLSDSLSPETSPTLPAGSVLNLSA
ncbi:MAG: hypothetical protein V4792_18695 [Pseudomonadota bacterium]